MFVTDDTDAVLLLGRGILEQCGYHVHIARDGEEALRLFDQHADDVALVVTDLVMPRMGGPPT